MPHFKVTLEPERVHRERLRKNPFDPIRISMPWNESPGKVVFYRVWKDMEAESKTAIRRYFKQAQENDLEHVRGHRIKSIERLSAKPRRMRSVGARK